MPRTLQRAPFMESPALAPLTMHLRHGFFGRQGGVSRGKYNSLNTGPGSLDKPASIATNRNIVCETLGAEAGRMVTLRQAHTNRAVVIDAPMAPEDAPQADAIITQRPGLVITTLTADCAPVLMCDPHANIAAAAHAGWRGALSGVIENAIESMCDLGARPEHIVAAIGPCISKDSFEVGPEFEETFVNASPWAERLFTPGEGDRLFFDLKRYCIGRLTRAGVGKCDALSDDTVSRPDQYFSYRRACAKRETDYGRNASSIVLVG